MLSPTQLAELRAAVQAVYHQPDPGPYRVATCVDGPLAGLHVRLEPGIAKSPEAIFGWCQLGERGLVVAYYVPSGRPDEWRFRGYEEPGGNAGLARDRSRHKREKPVP